MARRRNPSADEAPLQRSCGTMAAHMMLLEQHPEAHARIFRLEAATARMRAEPLDLEALETTTIRVIVHVVFNTDGQNVSDAQIQSQIDVLNRDFRARNPDRSNTPDAWKGLISDSRIEFELHDTTRTKTDRTAFS